MTVQSRRDKRLPTRISTCARSRQRFARARSHPALSEDLDKHRIFRKPKFKSTSTSLLPMNPVAPVTKIHSSFAMMQSVGLTSMFVVLSDDVRFVDRVESDRSQ